MNELAVRKVSCPYCGETLQVMVDPQEVEQAYIEDCQVCCRPITLAISSDIDGDIVVTVYDENDVFQ